VDLSRRGWLLRQVVPKRFGQAGMERGEYFPCFVGGVQQGQNGGLLLVLWKEPEVLVGHGPAGVGGE